MGIGKTVFTEEQIQSQIEEIAKEINRDYQGQELVIVSILKGSLYFVADLTRRLTMPLSIDFLSIGVSPGADNKPRVVRIKKDLDLDLRERQVLLVEDLIGTGLTLAYVCQRLEMDKPASLKICTLLDKSKDRLLPIKIDYRCFAMPDRFLVGYGLDYNEQYRNLPYIAEFRKSEFG